MILQTVMKVDFISKTAHNMLVSFECIYVFKHQFARFSIYLSPMLSFIRPFQVV